MHDIDLEELQRILLRKRLILGRVKRGTHRRLMREAWWEARYIAMSPNIPKDLLVELARDYPFQAARNPRIFETPRAMARVIRALEGIPKERLRHLRGLFSEDAKALSYLVGALEYVPSRFRPALIRLAREAGYPLHHLGPLPVEEAQAQGAR
ncbi:hypothetical protein [Thermus sp.]|uniref:hypothetical protein n=1 Tax=Thermus sp. TaxID=275 RepID=UPI0025DBA3AF|nr:hypothetical protein [Thermus sp.]MCS6868374.1 hypothetical protein [Thermus sp.]MDW8358609.1 hypothetical protein [Thermus sp.]